MDNPAMHTDVQSSSAPAQSQPSQPSQPSQGSNLGQRPALSDDWQNDESLTPEMKENLQNEKYAVDKMMKDIEANDKSPQFTNENDSQEGEAEWYFDENIKGEGPRPEYLKEKYGSIAEQAKAYNHLEKRLGGAPEQYELNISEDLVQQGYDIDLDSQGFEGFEQYARKWGFTNEMLNEGIDLYLRSFEKLSDVTPEQAQQHRETEMKKLGPDWGDRLKQMETRGKDALSSEEYELMKGAVDNAEMAKVMYKLMFNNQPQQIPTYKPEPEVKTNPNDVYSDPRWNSDPKWREAQIKKMFPKITEYSNF